MSHRGHTRNILQLVTATAAFAFVVIAAAESSIAQSGSAKANDKYDITLTTTPNPPKTGETTLAVTVKGPDDKPVTDGDVMVMFYMAAMPAMKMPEMKNNVTLKHESAGKYVGKGQVMMAGKWDVTVMVKRAGKEVASRKFNVTAAQS